MGKMINAAIYPQRQNTMGAIGNAMSAFGNTTMQFAQLMQQNEERKAKKDLGKLYADLLDSYTSGTESANMLSQPSTISALDTVKLPPPEAGSTQSIDPTGSIKSALTKDLEPGLIPETPAPAPELQNAPMTKSVFADAGMPDHTATDATPAPVEPAWHPPMASALSDAPSPEQPASPAATPEPQGLQDAGVNPAILARASAIGAQKVEASTPPQVYQKFLADYKKMAAAAARAGHPEVALHFMDKQLDILSKEYGADTKMSQMVIEFMLKQNLLGAQTNAKVDESHRTLPDKIALKGAVPGANPKAPSSADAAAKRLAYREGEDNDKFKERVVRAYTSDSVVKKAKEMSRQAGTIIQLIDSGNPVAAKSVPTFMARASGEVGNLSEADKAPFGGSQAIVERINQAIENAKTGTLTPENAKFVKDLAVLMRDKASTDLESQVELYSSQNGLIRKDVSQDDLRNILSGGAKKEGGDASTAPVIKKIIGFNPKTKQVKLEDGSIRAATSEEISHYAK